jgi:hypothetical protein
MSVPDSPEYHRCPFGDCDGAHFDGQGSVDVEGTPMYLMRCTHCGRKTAVERIEADD